MKTNVTASTEQMTKKVGTLNACVTLDEGMAFSATADSGFTVRLDSGPGAGGADSGFRPLELMLISLASCTAMDVISILRKKRQDVSHLEVRAETERAEEHPKVFTEILLTYIVGGAAVEVAALERSIELSLTKYCPAHAMLSQAVTIRHRYEIHETTGLETA